MSHRFGAASAVRCRIPLLLALACAACDIPRDPRGTLDRVRGGVMRVGVSDHAPWVSLDGGEPTGIEPELLRSFASELGARIAWTPGAETQLMEALERGQLDIVATGLTESTAWSHRVALTRPHRTTATASGRHRGQVMATSPGENGWLLEVNRFVMARRARARSPSAESEPIP